MLRNLLAQQLLTCPACRGVREGQFHDHPLHLHQVLEERDGHLVQGFLACRGCSVRYPVIDGVAVIIKDTAAWLRRQERAVFWRDDLSFGLGSWLLQAWPDDQDPNWRRQMLATYAWNFHPDGEGGDAGAGEDASASAWLFQRRRRTLEFLAERQRLLVEGAGHQPLVWDAGASVGASSLAMAAMGARVVAMDLDFGPLRLLARLLRERRVTVPRWRHGGFDYVPREITLPPDCPPSQVAVIAADASDPPVRARSMNAVTAYNLLDNAADPVLLLRQLVAALRPGGTLVLSSPYDWVSRATPLHKRLGEALRRSAGDEPDAATALRHLLTGALPALAPELHCQITHEVQQLPWVLPRHERSLHIFISHYLEARRGLAPPGA